MNTRRSSLNLIDVGGSIQALNAQFHGKAFSPHWHEEYAVGLITDGVESFEYRGATHRAVAQEVVIFDAGEVHTGEAHDERGFAFRMLYIPASSFQEVLSDDGRCGAPIHFPAPIVTDSVIVERLNAFHASLDREATTLERESRMLDVLAGLVGRAARIRNSQPAMKPPTGLAKAREILHENVFRDVSLDDLAREARVSKFHLLRAFRKHFGLPPHAYQLQQRVLRAKRLLENGRPVADIAVECGFVDQSHLNRVFRPFVGITPGQYAEQFRPRRRAK